MTGAYYEKIARIDLSSGKVKTEQLSRDLACQWIGGRGLGTKLLYDAGAAAAEPFSAENLLVFSTGPMTDAAAPAAGRYSVLTKSPVSGRLAVSGSGGVWGAKLKRAGWDAIVLGGEAAEWTYLSIVDGEIRLHNAEKYLGLTSEEMDAGLKAEHGEDASVLYIGSAGERMIPLSAVMSDKTRAAGRGGIAAVMGSKKLKAIVVKASGRRQAPFADPEVLQTAALRIAERTGSENRSFAESEWKEGSACRRCPIACGQRGHTEEKSDFFPEYDRTVSARCAALCDRYGLDAIGVNNVLAAAAELYRRGVINEAACADLEQDPVRWITRIADPKTELERLMAAGSAALCEHYGVPEASRSLKKRTDLSHSRRKDTEQRAVLDSMGCCLFGSAVMELAEYAELLNAATGTVWSEQQLLTLGRNICDLENRFNEAAMQE